MGTRIELDNTSFPGLVLAFYNLPGQGTLGGFPLGEMSGNFATKFMWACTFLFVYSLAGEIFLFKIVKMDLTNLRRKNLPQLFDQSKRKYILIFAFSANTFQSDQIEGGC